MFTNLYHSKKELDKEEIRLVEFFDSIREKLGFDKDKEKLKNLKRKSPLHSEEEMVSEPRDHLKPIRELVGEKIPQLEHLDIYDFTIKELFQTKLEIEFIKTQVQKCLEQEILI